MIIRSVEIENFRGFFGKTVFTFADNRFVLLSASNGKGKTSVIDAIEWCFTGDIRRLHIAYDSRSTNSTERKKNVDGLLKNKNCDIGDVIVQVCILYENIEYRIIRKQRTDILEPKESTVTVNDGAEDAAIFLSKLVDKNFYNHYFCDVQKAFNLLSKKREELPELFEDFISDYSREEIIARNLKTFELDVERKIDDLVRKRDDNSNNIELFRNEINKYEGERKVQPYSTNHMFIGEKLSLTEMNKEEMTRQIDNLYKCGYSVACDKLRRTVTSVRNKEIIDRLHKLLVLRKQYGQAIDKALKLDIYGENKIAQTVKNELKQLEEIHLTTNNVCKQEDIIKKVNNPKLSLEKYKDYVDKICVEQTRRNSLDEQVSMLSKGNDILNTFTSLLARKETLIAYRIEQQQNGNKAKCPICGSLDFNSLREDELLAEVEKYKGEHAEVIVRVKQQIAACQNDIDILYKDLISLVTIIFDERKNELNESINEYNRLKEETRQFFEELFLLEKINPNNFHLKKSYSEHSIIKELENWENVVESGDTLNELKKGYEAILNILNFQYNVTETEESILQRLEPMIFNCPKIIAFDIKMLAEKINSLRGAIANDEYISSQKKLDEATKGNKKLIQEITKLEELRRIAGTRAEAISNTIAKLRKTEYENVGPFLLRYFKKLARMEAIKDIRIVGEENKISLYDEKNKNMLNVLSNGQLSVFMLAYFLGSAISRSEIDEFRAFFIDDLTACMDDINMLAFLDFIKYQLSQKKGFMDQIFFVTCDDKIRKLLRYKLQGCDIEFTELGEEAFDKAY